MGERLIKEILLFFSVALNEKIYVIKYVPARNIVIKATAPCINSLNSDQFVIPMFATDIRVPIQDIRENGIGSAKRINSNIIDFLLFSKLSPL